MATKYLDLAMRAPRKDLGDLEEAQKPTREEELFGSSIERELAALIAKHGPDPDRIVELLASRPGWERKRAGLRLAGDYGSEAAKVLLRSADNGAVYDTQHPALAGLREASRNPKRGHGKLLALTARKRAAGKKASLPHQILERSRPLPESVRAGLERTVGDSAGDVRVVTGPEATEAAREVGALAFTTDGTIIIPDANYRPDTEEGRELLAHEAVHALQQKRGGDGSAGIAGPEAEHEADAIAGAASGRAAPTIDTPLGPMPAPKLPLGISAPIDQHQIARKVETAAPTQPGDKTTSVSLTFRLGSTTTTVKLSVPSTSKKDGSGGGGSPTVETSVDLDTSKLNNLLPSGIKFTTDVVKIRVNGTKLTQPITVGARYTGKAPYLKPVDFTFKCDTNGNLSAKIKLDCQIPGLAKAKSEDLEIKKEGGISGDIHITSEQFKFKGMGGEVKVNGELVVHVKNNEIEKMDGDAYLSLPQGFGDAKITANMAGGQLGEVTAAIKTKSFPGIGVIDCKLQWSEAGGFQLLPPGQKIPVSRIPGLDGSVNVTFGAGPKGYKFAIDAKDMKFKAKALQKVQVKTVEVSDKGLSASVSLNGVNLEVPGYLKIGQLSGNIKLDGAAVTADNVKGNIDIGGGRAKGSFTASYVDGNFKGKGKITHLGFAQKLLSMKGGSLGVELDLGDGKADAKVTGTLGVKLGQWADGEIKDLQFKDGKFTGKTDLVIKSGPIKDAKIKIEMLGDAPYVKAEIDAKNLVNKKLNLPFKGGVPVDVTVKQVDLKLNGDLSDISGSIKGDVKVDGGKLAEGDFSLEAKGGHIQGDLNATVKKLPGIKGDGSFKIKVLDDKITGGGSVNLQFEKYVKGNVKVGYDTAKGFSVEGKNLSVDIPGNPFQIKPFDVSYEGGKFTCKEITGTLISGKVPGIKTATISGSFVDQKLKLEVKDVTFTLPILKQTTLSAKWDDGKWEVKGEAKIDLPKGITCTAKFDASNGGDGLNFNCNVEFKLDELKKVLPGVEITSGKIEIRYENGKLKLTNAQVGIALAKKMLNADLTFSMNDDHTFNATGKATLKGMKFIKGSAQIEISIVHNEFKSVKVTGLELDLPFGKGVLNGTAGFTNGSFDCDLKADVTDLPLVQKASAHLIMKEGKITSFEAEGTFKNIPGIPLQNVKLGGKLEGDTPTFWADGDIKLTGVKEPLHFHFKVGGGKWEAKLSGTVAIPAVGTAKIDVEVKDTGDFRGDLQVTPTNTKIVKSASAFIQSQGGVITWGGKISITVAKILEGSVEFEKLADGDFMLKGSIKPVKAEIGGGKKKLFGIKPSINIPIPILSVGIADVHAGVSLGANIEAGIIMPSVQLLPITLSGKLSQLENGELPDVSISAKFSAGAYGSMSLTAGIFGGLMLLGASLDLQGSGSITLEATAKAEAIVKLEKVGDAYKASANLGASAQAELKLGVSLDLLLKLFGKELHSWNLGSKTWPLAGFKIGEAPLKSFEYEIGKGDAGLPGEDKVKPKFPTVGEMADKGAAYVGQLAKPYIDDAKAIVDKAKRIITAPYRAAKAVGNWVADNVPW